MSEDEAPTAPQWWPGGSDPWWFVHWSLEPLQGDQFTRDASIADAIALPYANSFRIPFASAEAATLFIAEIQRYIGSLALDRLREMDRNAILAALILDDELPGIAEINRRLITASGGEYAGWEERHTRIIARLRAVADAMEEAGPYGWVGGA